MQGKYFRKGVATLLFLISVWYANPAPVFAWRQLSEGLWLGEFDLPAKLRDQGSEVLVLKIDPELYDLRLLSASEHHTGSMTAAGWAHKFGLVAVINASMYQVNRVTSTGYMRNFDHFNNPKVNPKFGAFLVFNPVDNSLPRVQIIDKYYQVWNKLIHKYNTVIQNYRMISAKQENLWLRNDRRYNIASVGIDYAGNILFIHSKSPYSVYIFNQILLEIPINIYNAMFVEGGSEAFLYVNTEKLVDRLPGANDNWPGGDLNQDSVPIPNVIGVTTR